MLLHIFPVWCSPDLQHIEAANVYTEGVLEKYIAATIAVIFMTDCRLFSRLKSEPKIWSWPTVQNPNWECQSLNMIRLVFFNWTNWLINWMFYPCLAHKIKFQGLELINVTWVHVDLLFFSSSAIFAQSHVILFPFSAPQPQTPADLISCDSQLSGESNGIICHLTFCLSCQAGLSEYWVMNENWSNIDPLRLQTERQISHFDSPPTEVTTPAATCRQLALFLKPEALKASADLLLTDISMFFWYTKISWHTTSDICWTLWSSMPESAMDIFRSDWCGCGVYSITKCLLL